MDFVTCNIKTPKWQFTLYIITIPYEPLHSVRIFIHPVQL